MPGLLPGRRYMLTLHASNERGRSDLYVTPAETPADSGAGRAAEISELLAGGCRTIRSASCRWPPRLGVDFAIPGPEAASYQLKWARGIEPL